MSQVSQDPQTVFMEHLLSRYDKTGHSWLLPEHDFERWNEIVGSTKQEAYDVLALRLAIGFHEGRFPFWFCDAIVNTVVGFVYDDFSRHGEDVWSTFFYEVYLAFDAGEVGRVGEDPVEKYTRPMIAEIVQKSGKGVG